MMAHIAEPGLGYGPSDPRSAGRRRWGSAAMMVAGTLAIAVGSYSLSLRVSGERAELARVAGQNRALSNDLKALEAELRVRSRLPELQRWNDDVLGLLPITAEQYVDSPVHLAAYVPPATAPAGPPRATAHLATFDASAARGAQAPVLARAVVPAAAAPVFTPAAPTYAAPAVPEPAPKPTPKPAPKPTLVASTAVAPAGPGRPAAATAARPARGPGTPVRARQRPSLDPALIAVVDQAAAREAAAATPAGRAPADLLVQVGLSTSVGH